MDAIELEVHLARDDETGIWYIAESDVPGLRLEAPSAAELVRRIEQAAPEMMVLNAAEIQERHARGAARSPAGRRAISYRPVFDSPVHVGL